MKSDVNASMVQPIVQMEKNVFNQLVSEVKETVATDIDFPKMNNYRKSNNSSFGIVDLWNLRRNRRSAGSQFRGVSIPNGMKY